MRRRLLLVAAALALVAGSLGFAVASGAQNVPGEKCNYSLDTGGIDGSASAEVKIKKNGHIRSSVKDAQPNSLYTVWIDFRSRALVDQEQSDEEAMADDYPIAHNTQFDPTVTQYGEGIDRGVAPAFASTQGVTAGMGLDANTIVTDHNGKGKVQLKPDYHVLQAGAAPVVAADLVEQGSNRVGGGWMRQYQAPINLASLQATDPSTGLPLLVRATAQGFTIVRHPDMVSHGHTPGVGGTDHFSAFKGDFPAQCVP